MEPSCEATGGLGTPEKEGKECLGLLQIFGDFVKKNEMCRGFARLLAKNEMGLGTATWDLELD